MTGYTHEEVDLTFAFHAGTEKTRPTHTEVRAKCKELAHWILNNVPKSAEQTHAINSVREAMHWSNSAIACRSED
jgi:hypothetical protein